MTEFVAPLGIKEWYIFFRDVFALHIQWKYFWLNAEHVMVRGEELCYLQLIGLIGVQPYALFRNLRQFGQI